MMNKKATVVSMHELVEIGVLILLATLSLFILSIVAQQNIQTAEELASIQRDIYLGEEMLTVLASVPVQTSQGEKLFSECLNEFYEMDNLQQQGNQVNKTYMIELAQKLTTIPQTVFGVSRPLIKVDLYYQNNELGRYKTLYNGQNAQPHSSLPLQYMVAEWFGTKFSSSDYITNIQLPSSINNGEGYYLNMSMYFYN